MDGAVEQWVRQARRGDREAFARLIGRFERVALAVAYGVTGDAHLASDSAQEAFLRAWQSLGTLREDGHFGSWLAGIVRNAAIDQRRRRAARAGGDLSLAAEVPCDSPGPAARIAQNEESRQLSAAIGSLDEVSRVIVGLRYYEGMPSREIGELLAMSAAAVDMRLSRARQVLREKLTAAGVQEEGAA